MLELGQEARPQAGGWPEPALFQREGIKKIKAAKQPGYSVGA